MAANSKNNLEKTIVHQDLKFSVEFENGESSDEKRIVNTKYERNTSKDISLRSFEDKNSKSEHVKSTKNENKIRESNSLDDVYANQSAQGTVSKKTRRNNIEEETSDIAEVKKARRNGDIQENVTEITVKDDNKKKVHKTSFASLRGGKHKPLPAIGNTESGGVRPRWEKPGDPGEIPIQARITGPGPASYYLPSTIGRNSVDFTKRHSPAFSFGSRTWINRNDSPGPAYSVDPSLGSKGKENRPSYSFGIKPKTPVRKFVSPGPGSYSTDTAPLWEKRAPQYSLSPRTKQRPVDVVPAPNKYSLPTTLGARVPHQRGGIAITMHGRSEKHGYAEDLAKTPGPAKYGASHPAITKRRNPEYSVQGRSFFTSNHNTTPGPGAYNPQDVNSHLEQSPRHSIGVRHSQFIMPTLTPADCD